MHWWWLPCVTCTGDVFPSMYAAYTSYSNSHLDCMVVHGGGGGGGGCTGGCCPCSIL